MKKIKATLAAFGMVALFSSSVQAQSEESIFTNGQEIFLHKNNSAHFKSLLARNVDGKTYLAWVAENLKNDGAFIIYRSIDGENYEIIGIKQTIKKSNMDDIGYYFIDNDPIQTAPSYYKIMHIDTENAFFTSDKIAVKLPVINFADSTK
jgi:hypothetical protein